MKIEIDKQFQTHYSSGILVDILVDRFKKLNLLLTRNLCNIKSVHVHVLICAD